MKVMIFDVDDTLYDELIYVKSGFMAVATEFAPFTNLHVNELFSIMWEEMGKNGRGKVFDHMLNKIGMLSRKNIKRCLSIYRTHIPKLKMYDDAVYILNRLMEKKIPCYIVTDGNKLVQYNKIKALNVEHYMKKCYITHRFGIKHSKPSPYCFNKIAEFEGVPNNQIVYVGDNMNKDFVGIKPLGFQTVRIKRGSYVNLQLSDEFQAEYEIESLLELERLFL